MRKIALLLTLLLLAFVRVDAQQAFPQDSTKHHSRVFPMSVQHLYFHSNILGIDKNFTVHLPKSYAKEPNREYPVVYLLHGAGENDWEWANLPSMMINEAIAQVTNDGSAAEMVIVFPNATEGTMGYMNRDNWKYEDYFFNELMPYIESNYRVMADKGHRAIGGLSMGGGGSFTYGVTHPELFSSVYAISAAVVGNMAKLDLTPEQLEVAKSVNFVLDCGDDDFLYDANVACYQMLKKAGVPCQFRSRDGGHASYYWYDGLRLALQYFTRHFSEQCK